ncbi:hypothetical protein QQ020_06335 [Fulvivirgaceae bacterium BMA12]|uniref:Lipoprotein n=1 Tax=Agaribacillus aureus TaxID=3051825 RepID=A0ABT8L1N3_9BACT|nr:hypothetical protein [Fulvivirgaceae bacterium BMA12]
MKVMKQLLLFGLPVFMVLAFSSCKEDDVNPDAPILLVEEGEKTFIKSLELYYYGKSINIWDECQRVVGEDGEVDYTVYQPKKYDKTDFVNVSFNLNAAAERDFNNINFKLKVDMNKQSVDEIEEAFRDGESLTATNLILMLGNW